jgi:hypothetical protein
MNQLTPQQKKACIIIGIVIVGYYLLQSFAESTTQATRMYQQQARQAEQHKQQQKENINPELPGVPLNKLLGIWEGKTSLEGRGNCSLKFEMRKHFEKFAGYSTLTCPGQQRGPALNAEAAILSGVAEKGIVKLNVDKVVDSDTHNCPPTTFTLTPFGSTQLAAEWQEQGCSGGHALLTRTKP